MSAGGQRGIDVSGITGLRQQYASDVTRRRLFQLTSQTFASTTGANAYVNHTPNAWGSYLDFLQGRKEITDCSACTGLGFALREIRTFRS